MILKYIIIYLFIGWLYEGINYLLHGGIDKYFDDLIKEMDFDKSVSQEVLNSAVIFTIVVTVIIWPYMLYRSVVWYIKGL